MSQYNPATCRGAVEVYGIYVCRWNSGVPCALHKGEMCYMEKVNKATNELIKEMIKEEENGKK